MKLEKKLNNIWRYKALIAAFLVLFILLVPIPKIFSLAILWLAILLSVNALSENWIFSIFLATVFIAILFMFLLSKSKKDNLEFRQAFIENFADKPESEEYIENFADDNTPISVDQVPLKDNEADIDKPNETEIQAAKIAIPETLPKEKKISMMANENNDEDDFFGKLKADEFEDSDEDSDDDKEDGDLEKKAGKTEVSSKTSYKAQKQLYDLTTAVTKLHDQMDKLAPTLKKGQKIIESMEALGVKMV